MAMGHPLSYFLEDVLCLVLCQLFRLFYLVVEVASSSILHHHHYVFFVFKNFVKANDVRVTDFFQYVNFLEYFLTRVLVFQLA